MGNPLFQSALDTARVLVVEPSPVTRVLFEQALADQGCDLMFAQDGFDALSKIDEWGPGLVFAATDMPRVDGYRLAHILMDSKKHGKAHVVLLSHGADMFERARGRLVGAREHLVHPLTPSIIQEALGRFYDAS